MAARAKSRWEDLRGEAKELEEAHKTAIEERDRVLGDAESMEAQLFPVEVCQQVVESHRCEKDAREQYGMCVSERDKARDLKNKVAARLTDLVEAAVNGDAGSFSSDKITKGDAPLAASLADLNPMISERFADAEPSLATVGDFIAKGPGCLLTLIESGVVDEQSVRYMAGEVYAHLDGNGMADRFPEKLDGWRRSSDIAGTISQKERAPEPSIDEATGVAVGG